MLAEGLVIAALIFLLFWLRAGLRAVGVFHGEYTLEPEMASQARPDLPPVSIVVPARNEEHNIETCVRSLLALKHPDFEVVVVDDNSEDRTGEILAKLAAEDPRLKTVQGTPLPRDWCGKPHALTQGVAAAQHDWLLMTDADTAHHPASLAAVQHTVEQMDLKALSLYPRLTCESFWERLVQPTVGALIQNFVPLEKVNDPGEALAWANGQYIFVERAAYERVGGMAAVQSKVLEDVAFAGALKRKGVRYQLMLADRLFSTRMYSSLGEIVAGWSKNMFLALQRKVWAAVLVAVFAVLVTFVPVAGLVGGLGLWDAVGSASVLGLAGILQYLVVLAIQASIRARLELFPRYAILAPIASLIAAYIILLSAYKHRVRGVVKWKGREFVDR